MIFSTQGKVEGLMGYFGLPECCIESQGEMGQNALVALRDLLENHASAGERVRAALPEVRRLRCATSSDGCRRGERPPVETPGMPRAGGGSSVGVRRGVALLTVGSQFVRTAVTILGTAVVARSSLLRTTDLSRSSSCWLEPERSSGISDYRSRRYRRGGLEPRTEEQPVLVEPRDWGGARAVSGLWRAARFAALYGREELVGIARPWLLLFLLNGASAQFRADLVRMSPVRGSLPINVVSAVAGTAAAVGLAVAGAGYWALVGGVIPSPRLRAWRTSWVSPDGCPAGSTGNCRHAGLFHIRG